MNADGGQRERLERRELLLLARPALQRLLDPVGDGPHEAVGQLGPLDLVLHDLAQRRARRTRCAWSAAARAALLARFTRSSVADEQLVLLGVGEELDFVDGCHRRADGTRPGSRRRGGLSRTGSIRVMRLSDGVEWGVHVCTLLAALPADAALPAAKLAEYHGVPSAYLAKHLQALARRRRARDREGPARRLPARRARRPRSRVLDVVEAIDGDEPAFRCTEIRRRGPDARCRHASTRSRAASTRAFTAPTRRGAPSCARRRSPTSFVGVVQDAPRAAIEKGARWLQESAADACSGGVCASPSAAGAGPLAVVGLVAAGLELALLRLLAHEGGAG